ncbi:hypothetical protein [Dyadobacter crusticola]|uniref:hypothetical protein n=1 Tax=Dyadobacter crusticola TaxID=292407 RepID=UPI0004E1B198|nr:hypothetical protein [Dyadobacter crusticola]
MIILVTGPYRSGTSDDPRLIEANVEGMPKTALEFYNIGGSLVDFLFGFKSEFDIKRSDRRCQGMPINWLILLKPNSCPNDKVHPISDGRAVGM